MYPVRLEKLLDEIRESLALAKKIASLDYEEFMSDIRNRYTLRLALVEIVEAAVSIGLFILRNILGIEKIEGYVQIIRKLVENRILKPSIGEGIEKLVRLRNIIIHRYWEIDDSRIYREARGNGLRIVEEFVKEVEEFVSRTRRA
ncbi:MAG: HepT-like ribonuclease domain-containing protein [Thermoprotei archaeon]